MVLRKLSKAMSVRHASVGRKIERFIRERRFSERELLHLLWIFNKDQSVKITRNFSRRLLRLEKYGESTLDELEKFLSQIETKSASDQKSQKADSPSSTSSQSMSTMSRLREQQQMQSLQDQISKKRKLQHITRKTHRFINPLDQLTSLPVAIPRAVNVNNGGSDHVAEIDAIAVANDPLLGSWETLQKKTSRAGRKINVEVICAGSSSNCLPIALRSVRKPPKPKTKRQSATRKKSRLESSVKVEEEPAIVIEEEEEEEVEEDDEAEDIIDEEESDELPSFEDELDDEDDVDVDDDDDQSLIEELQEDENSDVDEE